MAGSYELYLYYMPLQDMTGLIPVVKTIFIVLVDVGQGKYHVMFENSASCTMYNKSIKMCKIIYQKNGWISRE